jgi:RNA polymerase sigma-70 factor (ECF subfamily)
LSPGRNLADLAQQYPVALIRFTGRNSSYSYETPTLLIYNSAIMPTRTNEAWLSDLRNNGSQREAALEDLRAIIQKGLPYALSRWLSPDEPQFNSLIDEVTQETLLRVLDQLDTFEGRSQFTTWVHKIAVRIALTELRRKRWRDASLDELTENEDVPPPPGLLADPQAGPEVSAERTDMLQRVRRIIDEELTDRQRQALILLGVQDLPMEDAARRLKTNRNALYKLLHDARLRLKRRLSMEDISPHEVLTLFESK